ncbi:GIY-YIG nuclease family protein [Streptacidiphilus carbonis]|uniref:GIY-YIG nuclease family protein n=1 Tax=Streptacidiphilus carbonis TaxID=105422 RepID=UPI000693588C|nr:GIY-YIG nuclease family protein [Streptacidiphilus carbonis]
MKFKSVTEYIRTPHTIDGTTVMVDIPRETLVPVAPKDWDAIVVRGVHGIVLALTLISVIWSTTSIAALLGATWVSYLAASLFDLSWLTALGLAFIARHRPDRRRVADRLSWVLLAVTVTALFVEGMRSRSLALACVGATVSILAKLLWWVSAKVTEPTLTAADRQWIEITLSEASAKLAVASARRQVQRTEDNAVAQLLAMEASRRGTPGVGTAAGQHVAVGAKGEPLQADSRTSAQLRRELDATRESFGKVVHAALDREQKRKASRRQPTGELAGTPGVRVADVAALLGSAHPPIVYFVQNGDRVKIGTSQNLKRRIDTLCLRMEDVLLVVHGNARTERDLHLRFAEQRVGATEWFDLAGDVAQYLAAMTGQVGPVPVMHGDAPDDAPQLTESDDAALPATKTAAILAASSMLHPEATPADIALHLAQSGLAVDTAYIRTVLSRAAKQAQEAEAQAGTEGYL